jgi:hypothetical protein
MLKAGVVDEDVDLQAERAQSLRLGQVDDPGLPMQAGGHLGRALRVLVGDDDGGAEPA